MGSFLFKGIRIPTRLLELTGGGADTFEKISDHHIKCLQRHLELKPYHHVLEVGCGIGRDAIPLLEMINDQGSYTGIDIISESIDFCVEQISSRNKAFQFHHLNIRDQLHNSKGSEVMSEVLLPLPDASMDRVFLWSVFTHMFEWDIAHYLSEFRRVLRPGGMVFATCFLVSPEILNTARVTNLTKHNLSFRHRINLDTYINDPVHPLGAIAYTHSKIDQLISEAGLIKKRDFLRGGWSGFYDRAEDGQDAFVVAKAEETFDEV